MAAKMSVRQLEANLEGDFLSYLPIALEICVDAGSPDGLFILLCPTPILMGKCDRLVRHHMMEMAARFNEGGDTTLGTKAEALCGLLMTNSDLPWEVRAPALSQRLYFEIMGDAENDDMGEPSCETRITTSDEACGTMRAQLESARLKTSEPTRHTA